ncbi:Uncharacterized protein PBTT_03831 [Plasmodiophora brassicae]
MARHVQTVLLACVIIASSISWASKNDRANAKFQKRLEGHVKRFVIGQGVALAAGGGAFATTDKEGHRRRPNPSDLDDMTPMNFAAHAADIYSKAHFHLAVGEGLTHWWNHGKRSERHLTDGRTAQKLAIAGASGLLIPSVSAPFHLLCAGYYGLKALMKYGYHQQKRLLKKAVGHVPIALRQGAANTEPAMKIRPEAPVGARKRKSRSKKTKSKPQKSSAIVAASTALSFVAVAVVSLVI